MGMDRLDVHQLHLGSHDQVHVPLVLVVHVELTHGITLILSSGLIK